MAAAEAGARRRAAARRRPAQAERVPVTVQRVVQAAFELVEQDGLAALSMRKLAERLGIQAATLYWHVQDKHDLIDLLAEALFAEVPFEQLDAAGDWKEDLHAFGIFFRRYLLGRRDAAQILANRFIVGPSMISSVERLLGWLRGSGLGDRESSYALISCLVYIHGFVLWETTPMSAPVARGETARDYLEEVRQDLEGLSAREFPHTVALAGHLTSQGNDDRFAFGLTCLLDGIEAQARLQGG